MGEAESATMDSFEREMGCRELRLSFVVQTHALVASRRRPMGDAIERTERNREERTQTPVALTTQTMAVPHEDERKPRLFRPWILYPSGYAGSTDPTPDYRLTEMVSSTAQQQIDVASPSASGLNPFPATKTRKQRPKKFRCPHCHVSFSNNGQLKGHVRIHTGERPFKCDHNQCGKTFTRNEELTRHKRIHSGLRPFPCQVCGKRFGRKDHLKKHVKTHQRPPQILAPAALLPPGLALYSYYLSRDNSGLLPHDIIQPQHLISW